MDIVFNCSQCNQELAIDSNEAGAKIDCPTCGTTLTVPAADNTNTQSGEPIPAKAEAVPTAAVNPPPAAAHPPGHEEKVFSVPQRSTPASPLIEKPKPVLDSAPHPTGRIKVKTIKHGDCVEVGKDKFDEVVADFISKIGYENIISITPMGYSHVSQGGGLLLTDYTLLIIYRG